MNDAGAPASATHEDPKGLHGWIGELLVAAIALAVFAPTLAFGFLNWDDGVFVYANPLVTGDRSVPVVERFTTPQVGYPIPATVAAWRALWWAGAGRPLAFHAANAIVHALNAALLALLLRRAGVSTPTRLLAAAAFAVHPIVVEPVAWVTGLKDLLMTTGVLAAVLGITRDRPARGLPGAALALAAKPAAVAIGPALAAFPGPATAPPAARHRRWIVAGVATAAGIGLWWLTSQQETEALRTSVDVPFSLHRVLGAAGLALMHLGSPATLSPVYGVDQVDVTTVLLGVLAFAMPLGAAAWLAMRIRRDEAATTIHERWALAWLALTAAAWLPVSNLQPLLRFTADSYLYLPWACAVAATAHLVSTIPKGHPTVRLGRFAAGASVLVWAVLSGLTTQTWRSDLSLWRSAYEVRSEDPEVIWRLGDALGRAGLEKEEFDLYLEHLAALRAAERVPVILPVYLERVGQVDLAEDWFDHAFRRPAKQADGIYLHYVEFLALHPGHHDPSRDDALRYALTLYAASGRLERASPAQREVIAREARRLRIRLPR